MKSLGGATIFGQKMYRVIGNVGLLLLLGHFLPLGGRSPLTGEVPAISIEVCLNPVPYVSAVCCSLLIWTRSQAQGSVAH